MIDRPVTKEYLKNGLIKLYAEFSKPNGSFNGFGHSTSEAIEHHLPRFLKLNNLQDVGSTSYPYRLTTEETMLAIRAIDELKTGGFVQYKTSHLSMDWLIITSEGVNYVENNLPYHVLEWVELDKLIIDKELLLATKELFISGKIDEALFKALRLLEIKVREKANLTPEFYGEPLMNEVFGKNPLLTSSKFKVMAEGDGLRSMMVGAIKLIRNPNAHGETTFDLVQTRSILVHIDFLLGLLKDCYLVKL